MLDLIDQPDMSTVELGDSIARRFYETGDLTLSLVDLSQLPPLEAELDTLARSINAEEDWDGLYSSINGSYSYDGSYGVDRDLYGLLDGLQQHAATPEIRTQAQRVQQKLADVIVLNYINAEEVSGANGLSIYAPPESVWSLEESYFQSTWAENSQWDELIRTAYEAR